MKQQSLRGEARHLLDAPSRIKAFVKEVPVRRAHKARASGEPSSPIYLLAAITVGIPALLMIPLIEINPEVREGMLATLTKFLVFSAFLVAAVFEIKRLADQSSDENHC